MKIVSMQLGAAQSCYCLLEEQLDYMRKMTVNAELEKKLVLEQQTQIPKGKGQNQCKKWTSLKF